MPNPPSGRWAFTRLAKSLKVGGVRGGSGPGPGSSKGKVTAAQPPQAVGLAELERRLGLDPTSLAHALARKAGAEGVQARMIAAVASELVARSTAPPDTPPLLAHGIASDVVPPDVLAVVGRARAAFDRRGAHPFAIRE